MASPDYQAFAELWSPPVINTDETPVPYPDWLGPLFRFVRSEDAARIHRGHTDPSRSRVALPRPNLAHDASLLSFGWCGLGEVTADTPIDSLEIPGHSPLSGECFVLKVVPTRANGIYIADHFKYTQRREELFQAIRPRSILSVTEMQEALLARANTVVPVTEYAGGYQEPIVLVGRGLGYDEVTLVSGPWPECRYVRRIAENPATKELLDAAMAAHTEFFVTLGHAFGDGAAEAYYRAIRTLAEHLSDMSVDTEMYSPGMDNVDVARRLTDVAVESRFLGLF